MAELVRDLGQYLIDANIIEEFGTDLFLNYLPENPDNIICLTEYSSNGTSPEDGSIVRHIQVRVRDNDYVTANSKAWSIYNLFIKEDQLILYPYPNRYLIPSALQSPVPLMVDDRERQHFVFNLSFTTNKDYN